MEFKYFQPVSENKAPPPPHFAVVLKFMHGDADADTEKKHIFTDENDAFEFIRRMKIFGKVDPYEPELAEVAAELGVSEEDALIEFYEYIPADITCDWYRAKFRGFEVFYDNGYFKTDLRLK